MVVLLLTTALVAGFCPLLSVRSNAQTLYDLTFTYGDHSVKREGVKLNTGAACITYSEIESLFYAESGESRRLQQINGLPASLLNDAAHKRVLVVKAFHNASFSANMDGIDTYVGIAVTCTEHAASDPEEDGGDAADEENGSAGKPAASNPDTVEGSFLINGQPQPGAAMGKMKQGPAAQAVFAASYPAGWHEAYTFNIAIGGKTDHSSKSGTLHIMIPRDLQKEGRKFAVMGLDKGGKAVLFPDTDQNPVILTANINIEGYAFALIHTD